MIGVDPRLREELALCSEFRIPHSHLLGGPDRWTDLDRDKALAWRRWVAEHCPGCGTRAQEWNADRNAYSAVVHQCPGCQVRGDREHDVQESDAQMSGLYVRLIPRAEADRRQLGPVPAARAASSPRSGE